MLFLSSPSLYLGVCRDAGQLEAWRKMYCNHMMKRSIRSMRAAAGLGVEVGGSAVYLTAEEILNAVLVLLSSISNCNSSWIPWFAPAQHFSRCSMHVVCSDVAVIACTLQQLSPC
jgi:hypothetical protein